MKLVLFVGLLLLLNTVFGQTEAIDIDKVSGELVTLIQKDLPIILEVQAGDMTVALDNALKRKLLEENLDIREINREIYLKSEAEDIDFGSAIVSILSEHQLTSANFVRISVETQWKTKELNKLFTYHRLRYPQYIFSVQNIILPEYRLKQTGIFVANGSPDTIGTSDDIRIKWYDPLIAVTAIGTLIYMLWNIE